jgi:hypothetical protein
MEILTAVAQSMEGEDDGDRMKFGVDSPTSRRLAGELAPSA